MGSLQTFYLGWLKLLRVPLPFTLQGFREVPGGVLVRAGLGPVDFTMWLASYLWLVGNGRMVVIVVIIVPHASIPY